MMFKMKKIIHPIDELELMAYLDGELPRERAAAAAVHLEGCRECQQIAEDLRGVSQEVVEWSVPVSDFPITAEMLTALEDHTRKQENAPKRRRRTWQELLRMRRVWVSGVAAVLLTVLLVSTYEPHYATDERPQKFFDTYTTPSTTADRTRSSESQAPSNYSYYSSDGLLPAVPRGYKQ